MLVLINRYFRSRNSPAGGGDEMAPADRDHLCLPGCVPVRAKRAASHGGKARRAKGAR